MYQALYRKWRPKTFEEVVGQEHITRILSTQVSSGKLSHAYLFVGSRGTGKTTCARILARAVNCENPVNGNPCCSCAACRSILDGSAPEIVEIDAASNNGVDDVRALRDEAIYSPATLKKRVYIIDEVHMLSKPAFNSLLKILEEPPEHLLFILATTELNKIPATILSRCQRFNFKRIDSDSIAANLKKIAAAEDFNLHDDAAALLAGLAEGGMRDALSLLDQCASCSEIDVESVRSVLGLAGNTVILEMLENIISGNTENVISSFESLWNEGKNPQTVLQNIDSALRDTLMVKVLGNGSTSLLSGSFERQKLQKISDNTSSGVIMNLMKSVQSDLEGMRNSVNPKISAELCLISLCSGLGDSGQNLSSLEQRVARLEKLTEKGTSFIPISNVSVPRIVSEPVKIAAVPETHVNNESKASVPTEKPENAETYNSVEIETETETEASPSQSDDSEMSWEKIAAAIIPAVPIDMRFIMEDPMKVSGTLNNGILTLRAKRGYYFDRFNNSAAEKDIADALKAQLGIEARVLVTEINEEGQAARDIDELKKFDIVEFI